MISHSVPRGCVGFGTPSRLVAPRRHVPSTIASRDARRPLRPGAVLSHVDGTATGLSRGDKVRILAEAPGYERFEELIVLDERHEVYTIDLRKAHADD